MGAGAGVKRGQSSRFGPARTSQGLSQLHALPPRLWGVSGLGDPFWGPPLQGRGEQTQGPASLYPNPWCYSEDGRRHSRFQGGNASIFSSVQSMSHV